MDCTQHVADRKALFSGGSTWPGNWQIRGTRHVRGISYVDLAHHAHIAQSEFHGWLDRESVDDQGYGGIQTTGRDNSWDLSGYDALELVLGKSDGKIYSLSLEDDRAIRWVGRFRYVNEKGLTTPTTKVIRFSSLVPERVDEEVPSLELRGIRRFELFIRNSSGRQEGPFSLSIYSINTVKLACACPATGDLEIDGRSSGFIARAGLVWQKAKNFTMVAAFYLRLKKPKARLRERRSFIR